jgi:hypothetical protein
MQQKLYIWHESEEAASYLSEELKELELAATTLF